MKREAASKAVISLRAALNQTQAEFAVTTMKVAVTTVARWETTHPPTGETLLRLKQIARRSALRAGERDPKKLPLFLRLEQTFERLYFDEVQAKSTEHGISGPFVGSNDGDDNVFVDCYVFLKLKGVAELAAMHEFLGKLGKGKGHADSVPTTQR
jgi:hypothetical protein